MSGHMTPEENAAYYVAHKDKYKKEYRDEIPGFRDCEDCKTCLKYGCRHNPLNKKRRENI